MKKQTPKKPKKAKAEPLMPGADHGWPNNVMVWAAMEFNDNLRAANIVGCGYSEQYNADVGGVIPVVILLATNPGPLIEALKQFQTWMTYTGPDALNAEILYSGDGYYFAFGAEPKHLIWRTLGLTSIVDPQIVGVTYIKTIDSRQEIVRKLADYSRHPVAPVMVTGAMTASKVDENNPVRVDQIRPIPDCPSLLLLRLPIYTDPSQVPLESALLSRVGGPDKAALEASRKEYDDRTKNPPAVSKRRWRNLATATPAAVHMLRTRPALRLRLEEIAGKDFTAWQIEQAAVNQYLWSMLSPEARREAAKPNAIFSHLAEVAEVREPNGDALVTDAEAIRKQAERDLKHLLKCLGVNNIPASVQDRQALLDKHGYFRAAGAA